MMEILTRDVCRKCDGLGLEEHPAWIRFRKELPGTRSHEEMMQWFRALDHGYDVDELGLPDQGIPCSACKGSGYIETWRSLVDDGRFDRFLAVTSMRVPR